MEQVKEREKETTEESEVSRKKARKARAAFEKIKGERYGRFHEFFEPVSQRIDEIYKVREFGAFNLAFIQHQPLLIFRSSPKTKALKRFWVQSTKKNLTWMASITIVLLRANVSDPWTT